MPSYDQDAQRHHHDADQAATDRFGPEDEPDTIDAIRCSIENLRARAGSVNDWPKELRRIEDRLAEVGYGALPEGARRLTSDELWRRRACEDCVEVAGIEYNETFFTAYEGNIGWERQDGKRPTCFSSEEIAVMHALAREFG